MLFRKTSSTWLAVGLLLAAAISASAQSVTPEEVFERLFTQGPAKAEWFAPEVLAQVPLQLFDEIVAQYTAALGAYVGAEGTVPFFRLTFERGYVDAQLLLNEAGQIAAIWFGPPQAVVSGLDEALAGFHELPGKVSVIVVSNAGALASINPDEPLAVGSAFKLAIAAVLKDQVALGVRAWDEVVALEPQDVSLPTGILQDWPPGTPLTVQSLATLMISISDNTATDALLRLVGRETVEQYAPRNKPFLSTRELFILKAAGNEQLLETWRAGDEAARRELLAVLAEQPLPGLEAISTTPKALDVEWYFTVRELADLMAYVADLPFMSVNPGLANPSDWQYVAFKGGSEPGVLNLTTLVVAEDNTPYIISATWNNSERPLDETRFFSLYSGLLSAIKQLEN